MMRHTWVLALGLALVAFSACSASETASLPEEYLGQWYYVGSSGGIAGSGMGDEPGYIVIHPDNTIDHHEEDGTRVSTTEFTPLRGPTIFSSEDQWLLGRAGESPEVVSEVITVSEDGQTMSISDNVYDGFGRSYTRSR